MDEFVPKVYSPAKLAKWCHDIPHFNLSFQKVSAAFRPTTSEYLQYLGLMLLPGVAFIMATLVLFAIFHACRFRGNCKGKKYYNVEGRRKVDKSELPPVWPRILFFSSVLLFILGAGVAVWGTKLTADGFSKSTGTLNSLHTKLSTAHDSGESLKNSASSAVTAAAAFEKVSETSVVDAAKTVSSIMSSVESSCGSFSLTLLDGPQKMDQAKSYIGKYSSIPMYVVAAIALVILVTGSVAVCLKWNLLLKIFGAVSLLLFVVGIAFSGLGVAVIAGGGDFCYNPVEFAHHTAPKELKDTASYFCGSCEGVNPLTSQLQWVPGKTTFDAVATLKSYVDQKGTLTEEYNTINNSVDAAARLIPSLNSTVSCDSIQPLVNSLENELCGSTYEGYAVLVAAVFGASLGLAFISALAFIVADYFPCNDGSVPDLEAPLLRDDDGVSSTASRPRRMEETSNN